MSNERAAHQAGVLAVGQILATMAEVVAPLVIVRIIGKAEVGALAAVLLVYTTLAMFLTLGLPGTLQFHLPNRAIGERRTIVRRMGALLVACGGAVAAVQLGIAGASELGLIRSDARLEYLALLVGLPLGDLPLRMLPSMLVVEGKERAAAGVSIFRSLCMSLGTLVPLALGLGVPSVMLVLSGVGLLFLLFTFAFYRTTYRGAARTPSALSSVEMIRFAFPLGLTELVSNLNRRIDRFLIIPLGAILLAEYEAGSWQIPIIPSITYAVGVAYGPRLAELFKGGAARQAVNLWREQTAKTSLLVVPIAMVFIVAAEEAIEVFFTTQYLNGASVFRFYALMTLGRVTAFGTVLVAAGRPRYVLRSAVLAMLSNLALSVPLVLWIGFNGPALGTMLAFIPMVCAYSWYIGKASNMPFRQIFPFAAWLRVVGVASVPAVLAVAAKLTLNLPPAAMLVIEALIVVGGFVALGSLTGLIRRGEWEFLASVMKMRRRR